MKIKGGILIIGSLFWQDNQGNNPTQRKEWRIKRLSFKDKLHVKVPIRYGKESGKIGEKIFTMVFSKEAEEKKELGTAYVIPFKNPIIKSLKGIQNQARFLSESENKNDNDLAKGQNDIWCTIGILFNPNIEERLKNKILNYWKYLIEKDGGGIDCDEYKISEKSILASNGEILIEWIKTIDADEQNKLDELDFILSTCTKPNLPAYPCIEQLKKNVQNDKRKYFFNNIKRGISTYIDNKIINE